MKKSLLRNISSCDHCCAKHGIPTEVENKNGKVRPVRYDQQVRGLVDKGIIPADEEQRWEGARRMRNGVSHPKWQSIFWPGMTISNLHKVAEDINRLFDKELQ